MALPAAHAGSFTSFVLESPHALDAEGHVRVVAPEGSGFAFGLRDSGTFTFHNLSGTVTVTEWQEPEAAADAPGERVALRYRMAPARERTLDVTNATLTWAVTDESYSWIGRAHRHGALHVAGPTSGSAAPALLERDLNDGRGGGLVMPGPPASVDWSWKAGWPFVAHYSRLDAPLVGGPDWAGPQVGLAGPGAFHMFGGNVTLSNERGHVESWRLGTWSEGADAASVAGMSVRERSFARLVFQGTVEHGSVRGIEYGIAAPQLEWLLDGRLTWTDASGTLRTADGETRRVEGERVQAVGVTRFVPSQEMPRVTPLTPASYDGEGSWQSLRVDGRVVAAAASPPVAEAAAAAGLLAFAIALFFEAPREFAVRVLLVLYSRISPSDLLKHPQRRRIRDVVQSSPGIHMRELQRRVGAGWGAFRTHLRMLSEAGHIRMERQGGYTLVFPSHAPSDDAREPAIPHPVTRAVFDALPEDGTPLASTELAERVGISRQLLRYHLNRLRHMQLVAVVKEDRRQLVERAREAVPPTASRR